MADSKRPEETHVEMPFLSHLVELRDRILKSLLAVAIIFLILFSYANELYTFLADPLMRLLPKGSNMIAIEVASPFLTPLKLTLVLSFYLAIPFILYHLWGFIAPGLYQHEKQLVVPLLISSSVLFYLGMLFAYYFVFPMVFGFFVSVAPIGIAVSTDISHYLDFVLQLFFGFGVAFETPILTIVLIWTGITTAEALAEKRRYIIVGAFTVGMVLTPPDVFSQISLSLPIWGLFELGLWLSKFFMKFKHVDQPLQTTTDYRPLTPEEMEAEMAKIEQQEKK
ncbi:MAG: hypothetical protein RIT27_286 [Pseudomonadota bacterium]|jgi:sec-independent protein translocase protein TatC